MIYSSFVFIFCRFYFFVGFFDFDLIDFNCYLFEVGVLNSIVIYVYVFYFLFWDIGFWYIFVDFNVIMRFYLLIFEKNGIFLYMLNLVSSVSIGFLCMCVLVNYDFFFVGEIKWKFFKYYIFIFY